MVIVAARYDKARLKRLTFWIDEIRLFVAQHGALHILGEPETYDATEPNQEPDDLN